MPKKAKGPKKQRASALISLGWFLAETTSLSHSLQGGQSYNTVKTAVQAEWENNKMPAKFGFGCSICLLLLWQQTSCVVFKSSFLTLASDSVREEEAVVHLFFYLFSCCEKFGIKYILEVKKDLKKDILFVQFSTDFMIYRCSVILFFDGISFRQIGQRFTHFSKTITFGYCLLQLKVCCPCYNHVGLTSHNCLDMQLQLQ